MEYVIGIDLGTTYSCAAVYRNNKVEIIKNNTGGLITPSCIAIIQNNKHVGNNAITYKTIAPDKFLYDIKRFIGREFRDPALENDKKNWPFRVIDSNSYFKVCVDEVTYYPQQLSASLLSYIRDSAIVQLQSPNVNKAVITVPAYFNITQRLATIDAARIAGLDVLRLINEPTAAAIAFGYEHGLEENVPYLIYDFGGGTFDVTVIILEASGYRVKATSGDVHLGGRDIDEKLIDWCVSQWFDEIDLKPTGYLRLMQECEIAKKSLSTSYETVISVPALAEGVDFLINISRETFENDICEPVIDHTIEILRGVLERNNIPRSLIKKVILIGGSSRIPLVAEKLDAFFDKEDICLHGNHDEDVARGAALCAHYMYNSTESTKFRITDVTPQSLGIAALNKITKKTIMTKIFPKNSTTPNRFTKRYRTSEDNQSTIAIDIYEGESNMPENCTLIGSFDIKVREAAAEEVKIDVEMEVTANGVLQVKATEIDGTNSKTLEIKDKSRHIAEQDMLKLIEEGKKERDRETKLKQLQALKNSIRQKCNEMQRKMKKKRIINSEFSNKIHKVMQYITQSNEYEDIQQQYEKLSTESKIILEERVDLTSDTDEIQQ